MWRPEHRRARGRNGLPYPSDLTDAEWAIVGLMIPPAMHGSRKRSVNVRDVLDGIFYVLSTVCQWRLCRKTCLRRVQCIAISCCGTGPAHWNVCLVATGEAAPKTSAIPISDSMFGKKSAIHHEVPGMPINERQIAGCKISVKPEGHAR
jgi:hypothetical protein